MEGGAVDTPEGDWPDAAMPEEPDAGFEAAACEVCMDGLTGIPSSRGAAGACEAACLARIGVVTSDDKSKNAPPTVTTTGYRIRTFPAPSCLSRVILVLTLLPVSNPNL